MWAGVCIPYTYKIQAKLYGNSKEIAAVADQTMEEGETVNRRFTVPLPQPVTLVPDIRYRAWVRLEGPDSWRGQNYKPFVTEENVEFVFYTYNGENNGTSHCTGQFPGFLCSL
jgi:hypothetical protein